MTDGNVKANMKLIKVMNFISVGMIKKEIIRSRRDSSSVTLNVNLPVGLFITCLWWALDELKCYENFFPQSKHI